ncbi:hypothetical protein ACLKA7_001381 [Drosophila subpalustris]
MTKMLQLKLNHCAAAQDLLKQTVRELSVDVALLSEHYKSIHDRNYGADSDGKASIWTYDYFWEWVLIYSTDAGKRSYTFQRWNCYKAQLLQQPGIGSIRLAFNLLTTRPQPTSLAAERSSR